MIKYLEKEEDFKTIIKEGKWIVDFYAEWCGPCKMQGPILEEFSKTTDISVKKINVDSNPDIARRYGVMSIPTLILFENGKEVKKTVGLLNLDELKETFLKFYPQ